MITHIYKCNHNGKIIPPDNTSDQVYLTGIIKVIKNCHTTYKHRKLNNINKIKIEYYMHQSLFTDEKDPLGIVGKIFRSIMCNWH